MAASELYVYFIQADGDGPVRIGSSRDPHKTLDSLQGMNHRPITLLAALPIGGTTAEELHLRFHAHRMHSLWFHPAAPVMEYIRSLGRDIARAVGSEAIMSALSRTSIGPFQLAGATRPEDVRRDNAQSLLQPALLAITSLPRVEITQLQAERLGATGVSFDLSLNAGEFSAGAEVAAIAPDGRLFAIITPSKGDRWKLKSFIG